MGDIWGTPTSFKQTVTQKGADGSATTVAHEATPQTAAAPAAPGGAAPADPGAAPVAPPPPTLAANPAYNAFLNSLGLTDANLRNAAALQAGARQLGEVGNEAALGRQQAQTQANSENAFDARGTVNSGANIAHQAAIDANYGDRLAAMRNGTANSVANLYANLAAKLAGGDQRLVGVGTSAAGNDYVNNAAANDPNPFLISTGA